MSVIYALAICLHVSPGTQWVETDPRMVLIAPDKMCQISYTFNSEEECTTYGSSLRFKTSADVECLRKDISSWSPVAPNDECARYTDPEDRAVCAYNASKGD